MVVSTVLSIAPAKKSASVVIVDTWCVQMTSATKLAATTFCIFEINTHVVDDEYNNTLMMNVGGLFDVLEAAMKQPTPSSTTSSLKNLQPEAYHFYFWWVCFLLYFCLLLLRLH